ncbi:uncharacterized protein LOC119589233 [Penaeus monodon]|uniref:uncharacterized protein LOC119589233 n=1 Tax=Penaeus monodon TaxID=6687 RepID=UPI0018A7B6F6|nr:uncharacterized protein LOC119589233 [Penaeus monodon]
MHFWMDKRTVCGQLRAPPLWSPRPYFPKPRHAHVTPPQRFHRFDSMLIDSRPRSEGRCTRCSRTGPAMGSSSHTPSDDDDDLAARAHLADSALGTSAPGEEVRLTRLNVPTDSSSRRTSANSSSMYSRTPDNFNLFRMGGINWCVWMAFVIITLLLVPAHLYLKNFDYRGELIGIFFVIILLFLVCFSVSLFHTKTRAILLHRLNLEDDARSCPMDSETASPARRRPFFPSGNAAHSRLARHAARSPVRVSRSTPDLLINGQTADAAARSLAQEARRNHHASRSVRRGEAPDGTGDPPPYHVAIMLPAPTHSSPVRNCETPPPAYEVVQ